MLCHLYNIVAVYYQLLPFIFSANRKSGTILGKGNNVCNCDPPRVFGSTPGDNKRLLALSFESFENVQRAKRKQQQYKAAINPKVSIPDKHFIAREKVVGSRETTDSVYMSLQRTNNSDKTYRQPVQQLAPNGRVNPALEGPRQPLGKGNYEIALVKHVNTPQRAVSSADYLEMVGSGRLTSHLIALSRLLIIWNR